MSLRRLYLTLSFFALFTSGCAFFPKPIGSTLSLCCPGDYASYKTYHLKTEALPQFIDASTATAFVSAFEEKGMQRRQEDADLEVVLRYEHVNMNPEQEAIDPLTRRRGNEGEGRGSESGDVELRYLATIVVEIREIQSAELIYAGRIHRLHTVEPGEYMHEGRAYQAFLNGFRELLAQYPRRD